MTIRKYAIFKVLNNYNDIMKSLEEFDIFSIIERVVKCYMNVNTTLENTYYRNLFCGI